MSLTETASVTGASRSSFNNLFKDQYLPDLWDHLIQEVTLPSLICKPKGVMGGRRSLGAVITARPQSTGVALGEDWSFPTPKVGTYVNPILYCKHIYNRLRWTGVLEAAARAGKQFSWTQPRVQDVKDGEMEMERKFEVMLQLGYYQILGVASAGTATTATLYGRNTKTSAAADVFKHGTFYIRNNMALAWATTMGGDPVNSSSNGASGQAYVSSFVPSTGVVTYNDPGTDITADDFIFPHASRRDDVADANTETDFFGPNGLRNLLDDGDIYAYVYDLERAAAGNNSFNGYHADNGGSNRPFTDRLLEFSMDQIVENGNGEEPTSLLENRATRREVTKEYHGDRWFPAVQTESGFGKLSYRYGDRTLVHKTSHQTPPGEIWILNVSHFGWLTNQKLSSVDEQSERWVDGKDAHEINTVFRGNCFNKQPSCSGVLEDISFDVTALTV